MSIIVNPIKVSINEESFTMAQARKVRQYARSIDENFDNEDLERAAQFYADPMPLRIHNVNFTVTGNLYHLAPVELASEDGNWSDPYIDCWVSMLVECPAIIYRIGFYIGDFMQLTFGDDSNAEEIREHALIEKFVKVS